jgi:hypothetical protein
MNDDQQATAAKKTKKRSVFYALCKKRYANEKVNLIKLVINLNQW